MGYLVGAGFRVGAFVSRTTNTENATAGLTAPDSGVNRLQPFLENGNSSLRQGMINTGVAFVCIVNLGMIRTKARSNFPGRPNRCKILRRSLETHSIGRNNGCNDRRTSTVGGEYFHASIAGAG